MTLLSPLPLISAYSKLDDSIAPDHWVSENIKSLALSSGISFASSASIIFSICCGFGAKIEKLTNDGYIRLVAIQHQKILSQGTTEAEFGDVLINGNCFSSFSAAPGGGCLIATATYGTELAPQVQQLRELRDNKLLPTKSGTAFMNSFNDFYYSFSPIIADYERQNPVFKEMVKITITPMINSLSILNYVDMDSESEVLGYGISLIILNLGMYFGIPAVVIIVIKKKF